jgi:GntR family transcriptional regulator
MLLRDRIRNQEFGYDGRLPSESDLGLEFNVSRATIRTALSKLASEGLVIRKHGEGTFVNKRIMNVNTQLREIWDIKELIEESGRKAAVSYVHTERRVAKPDEAENLDIQLGSEVFSFERVYTANERPVIYSLAVVPVEYAALDSISKQLDTSIYALIEKSSGQVISYGISDINSAFAGEKMSRLLGVDAGYPLLAFAEVFFTAENRAILLTTNYYNDKEIKLRLVRSWF